MWFTALLKANRVAKLAKALTKYGGRALLRKTGVFGIYGAFKKYDKLLKSRYTRPQALRKITTSIVKKNILKSLGPANYVRDWIKHGAKYTLKRFAWNKFVPMSIKKIIYLHQNYESMFGRKTILGDSKREIWKKLGYANKHNTYNWKLDQIEAIMNTKMESGRGEKDKQFLLDHDFVFNVRSAQTHNFSQKPYRWNPTTGRLVCYVRSGSAQFVKGRQAKMGYVKEYIAENVSIDLIRKMINTSSYGKMIYWKYFK